MIHCVELAYFTRPRRTRNVRQKHIHLFIQMQQYLHVSDVAVCAKNEPLKSSKPLQYFIIQHTTVGKRVLKFLRHAKLQSTVEVQN